MDWSDVKAFVSDKVGYDGDSNKVLSTTVVTTAFDVRLQLLLKNFTAETLYLYSPKVALTLTAGDIEIDTSDSAVSAKWMCNIRHFFYNSYEVAGGSMADIEDSSNQATVTAGNPGLWVEARPGVLRLDKPLPTAPTGGYVGGWYRHPAMTTDTGSTGKCLLDPADVPTFATYASVFLKQDVVSDEVGLGRLKRYDAQMFEQMKKMRGASMSRIYNGSRR